VAVESLNVTSGDARGTSVALEDELVLGRSCAEFPGLRADTEISRVHARVWREDGELLIEDLGSRNGTYLNGSRIHGPRLLQPGDWLRVGQTTMEVANGNGLVTHDDAPRYDAIVADDDEEPAADEPPRPARGSAGHFRPWPLAAILAALLAGAGIGAAVAASSRQAAKARTSTVMVTHDVEHAAPRPRLVAPPQRLPLPPPVPVTAALAAANPAATYPAAAREVFVNAFCGRGASASKALCTCTYVELTRREPYALLVSQVSRSHRRVAPPIASAARACGAGA
jgi:FHA domain-containing protein